MRANDEVNDRTIKLLEVVSLPVTMIYLRNKISLLFHVLASEQIDARERADECVKCDYGHAVKRTN